jgi:hypothetical protein
MLERIVNRYLSWFGLFIAGALVFGFIWNWRLLSAALSFTGLLAVILTAMVDADKNETLRDNTSERTGADETAIDGHAP